jgi:putative peptidoglycan lipid II flippase
MTGLRATVVVAAGRAGTMALTFILGVLSARYFGASPDKDCYLVGKALPTVLINVMVGGVVPLLLVALARLPPAERPWRAGTVLRGAARRLAYVLVPLLVAGWFAAPRLVAAMAPGFGPDQVDLTARLFRLSLLSVVGTLGVASMKSLFNAGGEFSVPSFASLLVGVVALVVLVTGVSRIGIPTLALGDLFGQLTAALTLAAVALSTGRLRWRAGVEAPPPARAEEALFWRQFAVMCLGSNFGSVNVLVNNYFASRLPSGSIASLGFAIVLITSAQALFIFSAAEIAFARLARASDDAPRFRADVGRILRSLVLATLPVVAGTAALARPLIRALYERGAFDPATTDLVAHLLRILAADLLFMAFLALFWRVLVARGLYGIVGVVSAVSIASNMILDATLVGPLGISGIALATPLVTLITTLAFWPSVRRACGRIWTGADRLAALKGAASAAVMGGLVAAWAGWFESVFGTATEPLRILQVLGGIVLGAAIYAVLLALLQVRDVTDVLRRVFGALRPA